MRSSLFCFFLTSALLGLGAVAEESIVTNSPLQSTVHQNSVITDSQLTRCNVDRSGVLESIGRGSTIIFSSIRNSTLIGSVLNATYCDPEVDLTSTTEVLSNIDRYYFHKVFDSKIVNSTLDVSPNCRNSKPGHNSTVYQSHVCDSVVRLSEVILSNVTSDSTSCSSVITQSDLQHTNVANSVLRKVNSKVCGLFNAKVDSSICENSSMTNGNLDDSTVSNSILQNSRVTKCSQIVHSTLRNSAVTGNSKIFDSQITNSKVSNSKLTNCTIVNSHVDGKIWDSKTMINGMLFPTRRH